MKIPISCLSYANNVYNIMTDKDDLNIIPLWSIEIKSWDKGYQAELIYSKSFNSKKRKKKFKKEKNNNTNL